MKKLLFSSLAAIGIVFAGTTDALAQWAQTCTRDPYSSVNLRRGPGLNHSIIASIPNNSYVRILSWVWGSDGNRWYRVENGGLVGWQRADFLCK
jgi:uncharacterized protein YraI